MKCVDVSPNDIKAFVASEIRMGFVTKVKYLRIFRILSGFQKLMDLENILQVNTPLLDHFYILIITSRERKYRL